jgi:hypothetical protein
MFVFAACDTCPAVSVRPGRLPGSAGFAGDPCCLCRRSAWAGRAVRCGDLLWLRGRRCRDLKSAEIIPSEVALRVVAAVLAALRPKRLGRWLQHGAANRAALGPSGVGARLFCAEAHAGETPNRIGATPGSYHAGKLRPDQGVRGGLAALEEAGEGPGYVLPLAGQFCRARRAVCPRPGRCWVSATGLGGQPSAVPADNLVAAVNQVAGRWKGESALDALRCQTVTAAWLSAGGNWAGDGGRWLVGSRPRRSVAEEMAGAPSPLVRCPLRVRSGRRHGS